MPIDLNKGPGGVNASYGRRSTTTSRDFDLNAKYGGAFVRVQGSSGTAEVAPEFTSAFESTAAFEPILLNHPSFTYNFLGYDEVANTVFVRDDTNGVVRQGESSDNFTTITWSNSKALPTSPNAITFGNCSKILRFKGQLYLMATDSTASRVRIYRANPATLNGAWTWSAALFSLAAGVTTISTGFSADSDYMYLCEYGDPGSGPTLYRSSDGTNWTSLYTEVGQAIPQRHMHAVASDPFNPGHIWLTLGDANAPREIMRSIDSGATWSIVEGRSEWQAVQISFTRSHVWFAGDSNRGHVFTIDKTTGIKEWSCSGLARNLAVPQPTALTDQFYFNGWHGCVDPDSEAYYFSLQSDTAGGNTPGFFVVPYRGAVPVLLSKTASALAPVVVFGDWVWCGSIRKKRLGR